jgi:signal transduction histidine kinase
VCAFPPFHCTSQKRRARDFFGRELSYAARLFREDLAVAEAFSSCSSLIISFGFTFSLKASIFFSVAFSSLRFWLRSCATFVCNPPLLDEVGFASAARWYTDEFARRSGIKVKMDLPEGVDNRLPELERIALFRILQESLTNVHRHAGGSAVEISLKASEHRAVFTVKDFGRGMPAELIQGSQTNGDHFGVGLSGMRERVNDLGGTFEIQSGGNGTAIIVSIPLAANTSVRGN